MQNGQAPEEQKLAPGEPGRSDAEKPVYTPRPRWQLVMAWVLFGIVVLGIINLVYIQMTGV